jgi:hypothetical protein
MRMWDFRIHADSRRGHHGCPQLAGKAACLVVALHPLRPERLLRRSLPTNSTIWRTYMMSPEKEFDAIDVDLAQLKQRIPLLEYLQRRDFVSRAWGTIKGAAVWERLGALPGSKSRAWWRRVERACRAPARTIHAVNQVPVRKRQTENQSRPAPRLRPKGNSPAAVARVSPCAKSLYCGHFSHFPWAC